jgi:acetyl esterase
MTAGSLDPQIKALLDQMAADPQPKLWEMPLDDARASYAALNALVDAQNVPIGKVENRTVPGPAGEVPVRVYTPVAAEAATLPALVFFHGGGFVIGNLDSHDALCRQLANESGCKTVSVDYRLAPEAPFPAAVEDCFAAVQWVEKNASDLGVDPNCIALAGDSAGGNLAAVISLMARDKGGPPICFQLLIYPVTRPEADTESMRALAEGYLLEKDTMDWFMAQYKPEKADWRASPLDAEKLENLPPALVITAGYDPLRDEGKLYADRLKAAGNQVDCVNYDGQIHGFFNMAGMIEESKKAIAAAAHKLRDAVEAASKR